MLEIVDSIIPTEGTGISHNSQRENSSLNIFSTSKSKKCFGCVDGQNADGSKIVIQDFSPKQKDSKNKNVFSVKKGNGKLDVPQTKSIEKDFKFDTSDFDKKGLKKRNTRKNKNKEK